MIEISVEIFGVMIGDTYYDKDKETFMRQRTGMFDILEELLEGMEEIEIGRAVMILTESGAG